jgi:hypothetical protein
MFGFTVQCGLILPRYFCQRDSKNNDWLRVERPNGVWSALESRDFWLLEAPKAGSRERRKRRRVLVLAQLI